MYFASGMTASASDVERKQMKTCPNEKQKELLTVTCSLHYSCVLCFLALDWVVCEEAGIPAQTLFPTCH